MLEILKAHPGASRLLAALLLVVPSLATAETLTGRLTGHDCAERGTACPVDRLDPHVALESDFVLQLANGEYYFLVNVPRDVKVRHVLEPTEVVGQINKRFHSVTVDELKVRGSTVWSTELQRQEMERYLYPGALTGAGG